MQLGYEKPSRGERHHRKGKDNYGDPEIQSRSSKQPKLEYER